MPRTDWHKWLLRVCVALPLVMLAANVLAWLRWGTDLPYFDDWRVYDERSALSLDPARLFAPVNNTMSPIGLALDTLAQRWLGGNPLPYQTLSMLGVLGGLLALQWRLLGWAVREPRLRAVLFAFCFLMLQSGSYWGEQNLAYHQALPLLALFGAACLTLAGSGRGGVWRPALVFVLGLAAGLSYISGAVSALVMGSCWLLLYWWLRRRMGQALVARVGVGGVALSLAGALTSALQLAVTRGGSDAATHQYLGITWPTHSDFWAYLAGKIGRGTGHAFASIGLEAVWVLLLVLSWVTATVWLLRGVCGQSGPLRARQRRLALVLLPLSALVAVYLVMVSLGRAGLRDASIQGPAAVFGFAYYRFHFFWVTLLFPWLAAALLVGWRALGHSRSAPLLVLGLAAALGLVRGVFNVSADYRSASEYRQTEIRCLDRQLGAGEALSCPGYGLMQLRDLTRAFVYARDIHASFVRYFPIVSREGFGQDVLYWRTAADFSAAARHELQPLADGWLRSTGDASLRVTLPTTSVPLQRCRVLGVQLRLDAEAADTAQLFYRFNDQADYSESRSVRLAYKPDADGHVRLEFSVDSPSGFASELRIDPVDGPALVRPTELHVTCRLLDPP